MEYLYSYYIQIAFICFIIVNHLTEIYLVRRQLKTLQLNQSEVPSEFKHVLTLEDHQKAISYSTAKLHLSQVQLIWDAALLMYWFPFRGAEKLYASIPELGTHREVIFLLSFSFIMFLLNLPWSVYSTFSLEERFGFNHTTPRIFTLDRIKGLTLGLILGVPLLYLVIFLFKSSGSLWWLWAFLMVTAFQFLLVWLYPTFIAPLFNKFHPLEREDLKQDIEKLVSHAGFKARGVFVMDASRRSSHGNAYFTGFGKNKRVVFFDTLIKELENNEVKAILAHELGHLKLKHIPKSLITSLVMSFIGFWLMGKLASAEWFYSGHFIRIVSPGILLFLFSQALPLYSFWLAPVMAWISRRREFEADAYAAQETNSEFLISGLIKLYQQNASPVVTDKIYSGFYHSHPPALERIKKLELLK
jgi:STE24 endopeptidase